MQDSHAILEYSQIDIIFLREIEELIYEDDDFNILGWYQIRCSYNKWVLKIIVCKSYTIHTVTPENRKSFSASMMQMVFLDRENTLTHKNGSVTSAFHRKPLYMQLNNPWLKNREPVLGDTNETYMERNGFC
jgi:hypothetical protein